MRPRAFEWLAAAGLVLAAIAHVAGAQDSTGSVDTRDAVEQQIRSLEMSFDNDAAANRQAVLLTWLADLYTTVGRLDDAERAYGRILEFFPNDVGTCTTYARFLITQRDNPARADSMLARVIAVSSQLDVPPRGLGEANALRALALHDLGRCDDALAACDAAVALLDEGATEDALRIRAACLAELGQRKKAEEAYLDLIGLTNRSQPRDVNAFITLAASSKGRVDAAAIDARIDRAIEQARERRRDAARAEGARIVELAGEDGVRLEGTLRPGTTQTAVLLVPDLDERRATYTPYAQLFSLDGTAVMTVDLRGQGDSRCDSVPGYPALSADDREHLPGDVAAAFRFLRRETGLDDEHLAIVASGVVCGVVERALHENGLSPAVVYLSPAFDPADRDLASAVSFRPRRPVLLVAGKEDIYAVRSLAFFSESSGTTVTTRVYDSAGHAAGILRDPAHFADVDSWLETTLQPAR